jgi:hypothetical protein
MSDSVEKYYDDLDDRYTTDYTFEPYSHLPKDKIVEDVINKYRGRSRDGIIKYNSTLFDSPDGFYTFLNHLQEELMDATLYIEKLKQLNK